MSQRYHELIQSSNEELREEFVRLLAHGQESRAHYEVGRVMATKVAKEKGYWSPKPEDWDEAANRLNVPLPRTFQVCWGEFRVGVHQWHAYYQASTAREALDAWGAEHPEECGPKISLSCLP